MDVGEYMRRKEREKQNGKKQERQYGNMNTEDAINKYSAMSEEELMQELFRVGSVSSGNVSAEELDDFFGKVKSFLTPEQAAKMRNLIMQLKMQ